jgi:fatty acid desaturase
VSCSIWAWAALSLVITPRVAWTVAAQTYLVFAFWIVVNQLRTLAAHRYANHAATPLSLLGQVRDTNTFASGVTAALWAPLGMRYHALHHLMPALPYHAMARAHRRLLQTLPPGSAYHDTLRPGLWAALALVAARRR